MRNHTFFRAVFATQGILTYFVRLYYMRRGGESGAAPSCYTGGSRVTLS